MNKIKRFYLCTCALMLLCTAVLVLLCSAVKAWDPPIGIPHPPFGIDETVDMYTGQQYSFTDGRGTIDYPVSSVSGKPYTHYVDNLHLSATDYNNPYGTESMPRKTLPFETDRYPDTRSLWLAAGSVVEIHNGPYDYPPGTFPGIYDGISVYSNANASQPAFIRGAGSAKPVLGDYIFNIAGQYLIIENIDFQKTSLILPNSWNVPILGADYVSIRNNEFTGHDQIGWRPGVAMGATVSDMVSNVVCYKNHIHHYGKWDNTVPVGDQNDAMGVNVKAASEYIWVVDNHIHHNGGDSVHVGNNANRTTHHVYIGRNDMHDDRENAVDVKEAQDVIISQNKMYNYLELGRDDDGGIACTHQGTMVNNDCPKNIWWIFNEMFNASYAAHSSHTSDELYFIGNLIYNVPKGFTPFNFYGSERHYYVGNTLSGVQQGMHIQQTHPDNSFLIANNIFDSPAQATGKHVHLWLEDNPDTFTLVNNLYHQQGGQAGIKRENTVYTPGEMQSQFGQCLNFVEADPLFIDPTNNDFRLQTASPAIDAATSSGIVKDVFDRFEQLYGIDIRKDIEGGARPHGAEWDIGAYEYGSSPRDPDPMPDPDLDPEPEPPVAPEETPAKTEMNCYNNVINPAKNETATIRIELDRPALVTVVVYDSKGREIKKLMDEHKQPGFYAIHWNGADGSGKPAGSGVYMVHMKSDNYTGTGKIAIVK